MNLTDVVRLYVAEVHEVVATLRKGLGTDDLLAAFWGGRVPQEGTVAGLLFTFHGYGCLVTYPDGKTISFEFASRGRIGGFDAWRIWRYIDERGIDAFGSLARVEDGMKELEREGAILKGLDDFRSGLYFLLPGVSGGGAREGGRISSDL